jgi:hypothetical protein
VRFAVLAILVGGTSIATAEAPDRGPDGLVQTLLPAGRICDRRIRLLLTITNAARSTIWLDLDKPPAKLEGLSTSYCSSTGCAVTTSVVCGGDTMSFLRSDDAVRLNPGESAMWRVTFDPLDLRPGDVTVDVSALVASTRDLSKTAPDRARIHAEARLRLVRKGRCFDVLGAG